jgi:hypothetical protein
MLAPAQAHAQLRYDTFEQRHVGLELRGTATVVDRVLCLTPALRGAVGLAYYAEKQKVALGFTTEFRFRMAIRASTAWQDEGADGIAFIIQSDGIPKEGPTGGDLGYDGLPKSVAFEFDTWLNPAGDAGRKLPDPDHNHISVHTAGVEPNDADEALSIARNSEIPELSDGNPHVARITYVPGAFALYLDGRQCLSARLDLENINGGSVLDEEGRAWLGFAATTGAHYEEHSILSWSLRVPQPDGEGAEAPMVGPLGAGDGGTLR